MEDSKHIEPALNRIYLIGFMGVGKSTFGKKMAREMGYRFVDMDGLFEKKYKIRIDDFFGKYDEKLFRKLEHEVLGETFSMQKTIIATGGGTPCFFDAMHKINKNGVSVFLEMAPAAIAHRLINAKKKRPLIKGKSGDELIAAIKERLEKRELTYLKAHIKLNALNAKAKELHELLKKSFSISQ